jgi:hypothetical protein
MAKWWMGVALTVGWLGASASVEAQSTPASGNPGTTPPPAQANKAPSSPSPVPAAKPPAPASTGAAECAPVCEPEEPAAPQHADQEKGDDSSAFGLFGGHGLFGGLFGHRHECGEVVGGDNAFSLVCGPECVMWTPFHANFEYLLWWLRKSQVPPLVTTGATTDPIPGALGQPNTMVLLQGSDIIDGNNQHSGGRLTLAADLDPCQIFQINGSFFLLETRTGQRKLSSPGDLDARLLARPFFDVDARSEGAQLINLPGVSAGSIGITAATRVWGADMNVRYNYLCDEMGRLFFLAGGRFFGLDEKLDINQFTNNIPRPMVGAFRFAQEDMFTTYNRFYGGQAGAEWEYRLGQVTFDVIGTCALGVNHENVKTSSESTLLGPLGKLGTFPNSGLLVRSNNAGNFGNTKFAVLPEVTARFGYDLNEHIRISLGYTYLYIDSVAHPGDEVDLRVKFPTGKPEKPNLVVHSQPFWAQGFDVSLGISF